MKKLFLILIAALLTAGVTSAQEERSRDPFNDVIKHNSATEKISVTIPSRMVLHLQEKDWNLNLDKLQAFDPRTHEGCQLIPKKYQYGIETFKQLHDLGNKIQIPVATYPAFISDGNDGVYYHKEYEWLKGGLVCHNQKIVQKFSNDPDGWNLKVDVKGLGGVGKFFIGEYVHDRYNPNRNVQVAPGQMMAEDSSLVMATGKGTTNGFLDDIIYEGFYFDGTEVAGNHTVYVTFTLAGL